MGWYPHKTGQLSRKAQRKALVWILQRSYPKNGGTQRWRRRANERVNGRWPHGWWLPRELQSEAAWINKEAGGGTVIWEALYYWHEKLCEGSERIQPRIMCRVASLSRLLQSMQTSK